jgi:hypothetical protein
VYSSRTLLLAPQTVPGRHAFVDAKPSGVHVATRALPKHHVWPGLQGIQVATPLINLQIWLLAQIRPGTSSPRMMQSTRWGFSAQKHPGEGCARKTRPDPGWIARLSVTSNAMRLMLSIRLPTRTRVSQTAKCQPALFRRALVTRDELMPLGHDGQMKTG